MDSVNDRIWEAMYRYLAIDLGVQRAVAESRATAEVNGNMRRCDELADAGFVFKERRFLDIGAGLGGLSVELVKHGAKVIAVEPARAWCSLIAERLRETGGYTIRAVGEALPISDNSVDYVVSLQVLEHVQDPEQVIREAFRVLKPGGHIFIAYENYLSFWEPHYRVRWLPLLPKTIGSAYLRKLGRDPRFLRESITYTTFPAVRRAFLATGFQCMRVHRHKAALESNRTSLKWRMLGRLPQAVALRTLTVYDYLHRLFCTGIEEYMEKPR